MTTYSPKQFTHTSRGFTIIEVMIAMAIFTVVVTIGIGSVLDAINQHYATENLRTVMDSLNYVMEDMARNIRLGTPPHCGMLGAGATTGIVAPLSCPLASDPHNIISFNSQDGTVVTYEIMPASGSTLSTIVKQKGTGAPQRVIPKEVEMDWANSGFTVRGAEAGDGAQPTVVIRLAGTIRFKNTSSKFAIETTATQRALDS